MTSFRVVYLEPIPAEVQTIIRECVPPGFDLAFRGADQSVIDSIAGADFALVATTRLSKEVLGGATRLLLIQHQGVGYDNIDLAAARSCGIPVAICPAGTSIGVAEHVFLLILALYKRLLEADSSMRRGEWLQWALRPTSFEIAGKTVGLVGLGRIGREVATRARAFAAKVIYFDMQRLPADLEQALGVIFVPLEQLFAEADIVSLHVPSTPETRHLIDARALSVMKSNAILINTARGPLVDEEALTEALRSGSILGAGLDVFEREPPAGNHPLFLLPNAIVTPHIAAGTIDALRVKMDTCFVNMRRVIDGAEPFDRIA